MMFFPIYRLRINQFCWITIRMFYGFGIIDHPTLLIRNMFFIPWIIFMHALYINRYIWDLTVIIMQIQLGRHIDCSLESRSRNSVDHSFFIKNGTHIILTFFYRIRRIICILCAVLWCIITGSYCWEFELVCLLLTWFQYKTCSICVITTSRFLNIFGMNVIHLKSREPSTGITCPILISTSGTCSFYPVNITGPVINIFNSCTGVRNRCEHYIVSFTAASDRICITTVCSRKCMHSCTVVVSIINTCVLIIPRHRKSYIPEFQIISTRIFQCDRPKQGSVICIHIVYRLCIKAFHRTAVCRIFILSFEGDLNLIFAYFLFNIWVVL